MWFLCYSYRIDPKLFLNERVNYVNATWDVMSFHVQWLFIYLASKFTILCPLLMAVDLVGITIPLQGIECILVSRKIHIK